MDTTIVRRTLALSVMILLAACSGFTTTNEDEDEKWWDGFYGRKSEDTEQDCAFYGTCKKAEDGFWGTTGGGSGGGADAWGHSDSGSGHSDAGSGW